MGAQIAEAKHTPGQWKSEIVETNSARWLSIYVDDPVYDGEKRELFESETVQLPKPNRAGGWKDVIDAEEIRANVCLVLAAPELLSALKQLSIIIQAGGDFQFGPKGSHRTLPQSLEKLIAKAEGIRCRISMDWCHKFLALRTLG